MSRPHILMLLENNSFPDDTRVMLEANALVSAGFEVTVVSPRGDNLAFAEIVEGVRVYRYPTPPEFKGAVGYFVEFAYSLCAAFVYSWFILLRHGFDAIHVHAPPDMNALVPLTFKLFRKRFVYDMHDLSPELYAAQRGGTGNRLLTTGLRWFERLACRAADRLISTNETQRKIQIQRGGADEARCQVVRNGPNEKFLAPVIPDAAFRDGANCVIGYVGLMGVQDGVDYMLRALRVLKDKYGYNFTAVLVGGGTAWQHLQQLTEELGLAQQVRFTGMIPFRQVPEVIAAFDICVTPDPSNAYNDSCTTIKTMEYMALSKPIVCFETNENRLTAGEAALYAKDNDEQQLAERMARLMDDPSLRERMGRFGRKRVEAGLTWSHQAPHLVELYRELLGFAPEPSGHSTTVDARLATADAIKALCTRFAFDGATGKLLWRHLQEDVVHARLSGRFRWYYRMRPYLPRSVRRLLQRKRNQALPVDPNWHLSKRFSMELKATLVEQFPSEATATVVHPWPAPYQHAIVLTHDVETKHGLQRIDALAKLEERYGFRSAWFIIPHKYKLDYGLLDDLRARGHEIGIHGYNHDGRLFTSKAFFLERSAKINKAVRRLNACGFRAPMVHRNLDWMQALDVEYDASCFDVDPFQAMPGGVGGIWPFICGRFVELPYTLPQDHTLFALGEQTPRLWLEKYDLIRSMAGMAMVITHPDYLDSPKRLHLYQQLLEEFATQESGWRCLPREVARWWRLRDAASAEFTSTGGIANNNFRRVSLAELFAQVLQVGTKLQVV